MEPAADTLAGRAAGLVQRDILAGALPPGARLAVHELAARYGIGVTPLREGLGRLVPLGLVAASGQRGFRVAPVSRADLADITRARQAVEAAALRLSIAEGDAAWEAGIVGALHLLRRQAGSVADPSVATAAFHAAHKQFHIALVAACGSPRLLRAQAALYDEAHRYRMVMMTRFEGWERFLRSHETLAEAVLSRAAEPALATLMAHLGSTLVLVYGGGAAA